MDKNTQMKTNISKRSCQRRSASMERDFNIILPMWKAYTQEIGEIEEDLISEGALKKRIQVSEKMEQIFFDVIEMKEKVIGFVFYSVDGGIKGLIPAGYGYIMEFYVLQEYRRQHIATETVNELCEYFRKQKCPKIYLTPAESSMKFWEKLGFANSKLSDPDNHLDIYMKTLC